MAFGVGWHRIDCGGDPIRCDATRLDVFRPPGFEDRARRARSAFSFRDVLPLTNHSIMPTPSRPNVPLVLVLSLVSLFAGLAVLIGAFGLLVMLFEHV